MARYLRGDGDALPDGADGRAAEAHATWTALRREPAPGRSALRGGGRRRAGHRQAEQLHGIPISFNNVLDADAAWRTVIDFAEPTVAIIKHTNPCGLASHEDLIRRYERALAGDPISAFGGIVACNRPIDGDLARRCGPASARAAASACATTSSSRRAYSEEALTELTRWRDVRILEVPAGDAFPTTCGGSAAASCCRSRTASRTTRWS